MMNTLAETVSEIESGTPIEIPLEEGTGHEIKSIEINLNVIKGFFLKTIAYYEHTVKNCCQSCMTIESPEFIDLHRNLMEFEGIFKVFDVSFNKDLLQNLVKKKKNISNKNVSNEDESNMTFLVDDTSTIKVPCYIESCSQYYSTEDGAKVHFIKNHCERGDVFEETSEASEAEKNISDIVHLERKEDGKFHCPIGDCAYSSNDRSNFKVHFKRHANNPKFQCVCGKKFFTKNPLMIHFIRVHMREVDWSLAKSDIRSLRKTIRRLTNRRTFSLETNDELPDSDTDLNGPIDPERTELNELIAKVLKSTNSPNVPEHAETGQNQSKIKVISFGRPESAKKKNYNTDSDTSKNEGVVEEMGLIQQANESSTTRPKIRNKDNVVHKEVPQRIRNYKCPHSSCKQEFFTSKNLLIHLKASHDPENPIPCTEPGCTSRFKSIALLAQHQKRHNVTYSCDLCSYKTHLPALMTRHNRQHSGQTLCHECEICHEKFEFLGGLRTHLLKVHHEYIKCDYPDCSKRFKTIVGLKKHAREFHCNMRPEYPCEWPDCDAVLGNRTAMNNHMRIHTDERPFQCEWEDCGKWFRLKETLKRHLKLHQGYRPHVCPFDNCSASFVTKRNLRIHMERGHLNGPSNTGKVKLEKDSDSDVQVKKENEEEEIHEEEVKTEPSEADIAVATIVTDTEIELQTDVEMVEI